MSRLFLGRFLFLTVTALLVMATIPSAWGQHIQGRINVTVLDQLRAVVPGAKLELKDMATNDTRIAETSDAGTYSFVNLNSGKYKLTITKDGFQTLAVDVVVETAKTSDVEVTLQVGTMTQIIEVAGVAPVVDVTTNKIGSTIDLRHIESLPILGRTIDTFAYYSPGYTGTWNGLPIIAVGSNIDGVQQGAQRAKYSGWVRNVYARLENIEEMTVQTDQMDLNQGFGQGVMQVNYTTRRGTNEWHGMVFEDLRNDNLNANSWRNNLLGLKKAEYKRNEFGGNVGGPILKDKLFFFFNLSTTRQPQWSGRSSTFLTPSAQAGSFSYKLASAVTTTAGSPLQSWMNCGGSYVGGYVGTIPAGTTCSAGLYQLAQAYNTANGTSLPTTINSVISAMLTRINTAVQNPGAVIATTTNLNANSVSWNSRNPLTEWYPTFRVDYTPTQKVRMNLAFNRTKRTYPYTNAPYFPGQEFEERAGGQKHDGFTAAYGLDWTFSPTLINAFKFGYLYNFSYWDYNSTREYIDKPYNIFFPMGTSPDIYYRPISQSYPVFNASDTVTWQKKSHTLNFGFTFYREFDHYWNGPEGIAAINMGIVNGDPAINALTATYLRGATTAQQGDARSLYAMLTGRLSSVTGLYAYDVGTGAYKRDVSAYNLAELSKAWSLFVQDSWRFRPDLTINAGLRWDFTGNNVDLTGAYHNTDEQSLWGPSGDGNIFKPGTLTGTNTPTVEARADAYNAWNVTPQPTLGIAWNPGFQNGILNKILGNQQTVLRAGFSLRFFTIPYQYYWDNASSYGAFFYQNFALSPGDPLITGQFTPGSLSLGQTLPPYSLAPATYSDSAPLSQVTTFIGGGVPVTGFEKDIGQPYTMSWTIGIQRKFGPSRALEIRYNANRTIKQWIAQDLNEVNVFENGFLGEFIKAQSNLAICRATAGCTLRFSNQGLPGQVNLPIITQAFTGSPTGLQTNSNFASSSFITPLDTGAVGSFAYLLTRGSSSASGGRYYCNLVGTAFAPCVTNALYAGGPNGPGGGYPINFFIANPYAIKGTGNDVGASFMTDAGFSNYNSLQIDFRQRLWHGIALDANYTWSHTLGVVTPGDWTAAWPAYTLRHLNESYGPTQYDVRHVFNLLGTFDLPFGKGRQWANKNNILDKFVGGWTIGAIYTRGTGFPVRVTGGYATLNNFADGGVNLIGITREQLQDRVGVYHEAGTTYVTLIDPALRTTGVGANTTYIQANTTPGTLAPVLYLRGPGGYELHLSVTKSILIKERIGFSFQTVFNNAFNHPIYRSAPYSGYRSSGWGTVSGPSNGPRNIEMRAKISF